MREKRGVQHKINEKKGGYQVFQVAQAFKKNGGFSTAERGICRGIDARGAQQCMHHATAKKPRAAQAVLGI